MTYVHVLFKGDKYGPILSNVTFGRLLDALKLPLDVEAPPVLLRISTDDGRRDILDVEGCSRRQQLEPTHTVAIHDVAATIPTGVYELLSHADWAQRTATGEVDPSLIVQTQFDNQIERLKTNLQAFRQSVAGGRKVAKQDRQAARVPHAVYIDATTITTAKSGRLDAQPPPIKSADEASSRPVLNLTNAPAASTLAAPQRFDEFATDNKQLPLQDTLLAPKKATGETLAAQSTAGQTSVELSHQQTTTQLETSINDMIQLLQVTGEQPPHWPPTPRLRESVQELLHLTRVLDEYRPKNLPQLSTQLAAIDSVGKIVRQQGWEGLVKPEPLKPPTDSRPAEQQETSLPSLGKKELQVLSTSIKLQQHYDRRIGDTKRSALDASTGKLLPQHMPQYTLLMYHTLHGCIQLHRAYLHCPRTSMSYYHTSDVTTFERLRRAEAVLQTYHVWRRLLRLDAPVERQKSPLASYKRFPVMLFRYALSVQSPPLQLGLQSANDRRSCKRLTTPTLEKMYHDFKCAFMEAWTQCRVTGDGELVVLLDLLLQQKHLEFDARHHNCYVKWVFPTAYLRDRIRYDFDITFGRDDLVQKVVRVTEADCSAQ